MLISNIYPLLVNACACILLCLIEFTMTKTCVYYYHDTVHLSLHTFNIPLTGRPLIIVRTKNQPIEWRHSEDFKQLTLYFFLDFCIIHNMTTT